ncbi:hypothetical protein CBW65_13835 [Tumebacillus avium]|uniref:Uncharacterized protein n=1 Tax=Tumebacillus avium TaxID=1903704 RepID=A0A1Y0IRG4_9BACL|nr:hypothetical protein [Tumebacillus avium]ARU61963.1 hypothetical protein CBW65_13835 [Tumebacillus avium]
MDDILPDEFTNDEYALEYGSAYVAKMQYLEHVMLNYETGTECFNVLNFEGGLGKSLHILRVLDRYLSQDESKMNFLIVKKFNKEIERSANYLTGRGHFSVVGLTSENWTSEWAKKPASLKNVRVLFISHERYVKLCLSDDRKHFMEGRHVLIIDEKVVFPIHTFNKAKYDKIRAYFPRPLQKEYDKVCDPLLHWLDKLEDQKNQCARVKANIHPATISNFKSIVEPYLSSLAIKERQEVDHFLQGIDIWYGTKCAFNSGNISGSDQRYKHWGMQNNIILDASANIDGVYKLDKNKFRIINQGNVVDHSNCVFNIYQFNSSKSNIRKNQEHMLAEVAQKIQLNLQAEDRILLICHKENAEKLNRYLHEVRLDDVLVHEKEKEYWGEQIVINWYGNLVGKNDYSLFNKCWLIGTPNLPFEHYLLQYLQYSNIDWGKKGMALHAGRFTNDTFHSVQLGFVSAEIYQALKRIQRVSVPHGEFNLVLSNDEIVTKVLSSFKNSTNRKALHFDFKVKQDEERTETRSIRASELANYLKGLPMGEYSKMSIREANGIDQAHFSGYLKHPKILKLTQEGKIIISYKTITVL